MAFHTGLQTSECQPLSKKARKKKKVFALDFLCAATRLFATIGNQSGGAGEELLWP